MAAYFNELDPFAAQWLRNLIAAGHLPVGTVDGRDVREVKADDVRDYTACHFFGGLGGWAHALRLAGWPAARPVWTASLPCQPFSAAGRRKGRADERHLWPVFLRLVRDGRPSVCLGEQVASDDGYRWLARIRDDLEEAGYAVGAADLCAAGAGAPHIRQRLFWVAHAAGERRAREHPLLFGAQQGRDTQDSLEASGGGSTGRLGDALSPGRQGRGAGVRGRPDHRPGGQPPGPPGGCLGGVGDAERQRRRGRIKTRQREEVDYSGFWFDSEWLPCADGKARRTQPGLQPLVDGVPFRLADGRTGGTSRAKALRGIGNAIVPQVAALFVRAFLEAEEELVGAV
jgi:DNA (cytosine-5)-methyltransferase 1